jgi:hypothetical protein
VDVQELARIQAPRFLIDPCWSRWFLDRSPWDLAPHLSLHYLTLWHGHLTFPGAWDPSICYPKSRPSSWCHSNPSADVIQVHYSIFRHHRATWPLRGPAFHHPQPLCIPYYDFPFPTFTTFPTAIGPFSSSHRCSRRSIGSPGLPHSYSISPQDPIAGGRISLLDFWTPLFLSQGHQIISHDLYDIQLSPEEAWRLLLCSGFLYNLTFVSRLSSSNSRVSDSLCPNSISFTSYLSVLSLEQLALGS